MNRRSFFAALAGAALAGPKLIAEAVKPKPLTTLNLAPTSADLFASMLERIAPSLEDSFEATDSFSLLIASEIDYKRKVAKLCNPDGPGKRPLLRLPFTTRRECPYEFTDEEEDLGDVEYSE